MRIAVRAESAQRERPRFDPETLRGDFPPLCHELRSGVPLVYLDNAATSLKPRAVIEAVQQYYAEYPANVHRGLHALSERATEAYESARETVANWIGAADPAEVVFTRGATEAVNVVARSWGRRFLRGGDEVVATVLEHHSNFVPWLMLAEEHGVVLRLAELTDDGRLDLDSFEEQLSPRTRLVTITGMSNVLGTVPPLEQIVRRSHEAGAVVLIDAAQSVPHEPPDVRALDADFVAFSGHKMCGPTGIGVLCAKREHLEAMPPLFGGGNMVLRVEQTRADWNEVPWKFEAGTPPIAEAIGLGAAVDYLKQFDASALQRHERALTRYAHERLGGIKGLRLLGPQPTDKGPIVSFTVDGLHPHDLAQLVDREGVAVRAGHHCAMPLHERLGIAASARASFYLYNTLEEVDRLAEAIGKAKSIFRLG
ncbi:MAG: cysteine desulfurase [Planctomycetes bacterium]|nr:cysteine desulfurase [Planctomycetota bacterium]